MSLTATVRFCSVPRYLSVVFESLPSGIDTVFPAGRLVFHVFAALAEFERNLIRERTVADLKATYARGRSGGSPPSFPRKRS